MNDTSTSQSAGGPPPPPPPAAPPPPPRPSVRRDGRTGLVGGVAAGLANHLGIDVVLVRIGFVVVTLFTQGLGAVAYLAAWIFLPADDSTVSVASGTAPSPPPGDVEPRRGLTFWFGVALLTLGAIWFLNSVTGPGTLLGWLDGGVVLPLLLIGLGVALWRRTERPPVDSGPSTPAAAGTSVTVPTQTPAAFRDAALPRDHLEATMPPSAPSDTSATDTMLPPPGSPSGWAPSPPAGEHPGGGQPPTWPPSGGHVGGGFTPPPVPTRERSILTRLTIGIALVTAGILWMLDLADLTVVGPLRIASIALAIVGLGLLVGSVVGRGRLLILFGTLLVPVVLVASMLQGFPAVALAVDVGSGRDVGQMFEQPLDADELAPLYRLGAGELRLDLTDLQFAAGEDVTTRIEMGAGEVVVVVPPEVDVVVDGRIAAGELEFFDQRRAGVGMNLRTTDRAETTAGLAGGSSADEPAELTIELSVGFGDVTVERMPR